MMKLLGISDTQQKISRYEFVILTLARLHVADPALIERIYARFDELDVLKDNQLSYEELLERITIIPSKPLRGPTIRELFANSNNPMLLDQYSDILEPEVEVCPDGKASRRTSRGSSGGRSVSEHCESGDLLVQHLPIRRRCSLPGDDSGTCFHITDHNS